jgi:glycine oxidase
MKIVIVGAGVAGLATAWKLASEGAADVEVLERGIAGRGATWASAGMIAPGAELEGKDDPLTRFAQQARARWPSFAKELQRESGIEIGYRDVGSLILAETAEKASALQSRAETLNRQGTAVTWLAPGELRRREPLLSTALHGALHEPDDAQVNNRALPEALRGAIINRQGVLRENCDVRSVIVQDGRAAGVLTSRGSIAADVVILACGAWTNLIGGVSTEDLPPIKPAKGQIAACEPPSGVALPNALIWAQDIYLVPRGPRLFIGATVEDASFDTSITREARDRLLARATRVIPAIAGWRVAEMWAGLRPRTPDDAPVLGPSGIEGLYVAGGQFRNGILFAPALADAMINLVLGRPADEETLAFDPRRFRSP